MRRYIEHVQNKEPHERRAHALRIAGTLTALVFVGWLGTLGLRLANSPVASEEGVPSQTASVLMGASPEQFMNTLQVSTTSYQGR
jgi:hypothetical protein